jgi:peroxiredoxin
MTTTTFEIQASKWFNTSTPLSLAQLRGRVVVLVAFQMLCPGCVAHAIPQLKKLHQLFSQAPVTIVGLHTVFEHHDAMQANALKAFIHEYKLQFPIGIDQPSDGPIPKTMEALRLRGTPSTLIWNADGELCFHEFGHIDDLALGVVIGQLIAQVAQEPSRSKARADALTDTTNCDANACASFNH